MGNNRGGGGGGNGKWLKGENVHAVRLATSWALQAGFMAPVGRSVGRASASTSSGCATWKPGKRRAPAAAILPAPTSARNPQTAPPAYLTRAPTATRMRSTPRLRQEGGIAEPGQPQRCVARVTCNEQIATDPSEARRSSSLAHRYPASAGIERCACALCCRGSTLRKAPAQSGGRGWTRQGNAKPIIS